MSTLPLRQKLVDIAKREVGVRETPKDSNRGPRVHEYQDSTDLNGSGWPWCAAFVCWCIREWGKEAEVLAALNLTASKFEQWRPKTAAAYGFDEWARSRGLMVVNENQNVPRTGLGNLILHTGDIVTYDFSHVGIIDTDTDGGSILHTIEGNTDEAGSREGGGVYQKTRARELARTIIRLLP